MKTPLKIIDSRWVSVPGWINIPLSFSCGREKHIQQDVLDVPASTLKWCIREQRDNIANLEITFSCCFAQFHSFYISDNTCCQASECTTSSVIQMFMNTLWTHRLFCYLHNGYLSATLRFFSQIPWRSFSSEFVMFLQNRSLKTNRSVYRKVIHFGPVHFSLN